MSEIVLRVEKISKEYRLGTISHGTLYRDLQSFIARLRGKEDPNSKISSSGKKFKNSKFMALDNISYDVKQGEVLGIIGRNGAGKSTLLKIISKVTAPTSGQIKIKGRVASLLEVGTGFHPELTGRENIFLNGAILGMSKKEVSNKFNAIVDFAEVEKFIDTPVKRYSSGMYVRLAFAVAAHLEPEILIVDEVLAVGDTQFQRKCIGKMDEVGKQGRTILFVSHNMEAVSALCAKALVLHEGQISFSGNVNDAIGTYRDKVRRSGISVANCFSRGGSGGVSILNVKARPAVENNKKKILSGESMSIDIELSISQQYQNKEISVGIAIDSANGKRLFTNVSSWENNKILIDSATAVVTCRLMHVSLIPGSYFVSASVLYQSDTLDCAVQCAEFQIYAKNTTFFVGRDKDQGDLYFPCEFKLL